MEIKKLLLIISISITFPTVVQSFDIIDLNISRLTSGNPIYVQSAKDDFLRHYSFDLPETKKRLESALISIITNNDVIPDTVSDHEKIAYLAIDSLREQKSQEEIMISDGRTAAILLSGILKLKGTLPALVSKLNYVTLGDRVAMNLSPAPKPQHFPCAIAILLIGDTSVSPYLVNVVKKHPDLKTRQLAGRTMQMLLGNLKPIEEALTISSDSTEQENLKNIIKYYRPR